FAAADRSRGLPVRSHTAVSAELDGLERAIATDSDLVVLRRRPTAMDCNEVFLPRELQLDGRARFFCKHCSHQIEILILVLVPETAAHVLADHADFFGRNPQVSRGIRPAIRDALRGRIESQLIAFPLSDADAPLHLRIVDMRGCVTVFENQIRSAETFFDVSAPVYFRFCLVRGVKREIAFRPDLYSLRLQRLFRIEDEG